MKHRSLFRRREFDHTSLALPYSPELSISGAKMDVGTLPPDTPPPRAPQLRRFSGQAFAAARDGGLLRATERSCGRRRVNYVCAASASEGFHVYTRRFACESGSRNGHLKDGDIGRVSLLRS